MHLRECFIWSLHFLLKHLKVFVMNTSPFVNCVEMELQQVCWLKFEGLNLKFLKIIAHNVK